jgi:Fe-S-cluster containining protein
MEAEATHRILGEGLTVEKAVEVAEDAAGLADRVFEDNFQRFPISKPLACRQGCFFRCYLPVSTDIPTAIRIAEHMRSEFTPDTLAETRERIAEYNTAWRRVNNRKRFESRLACPLLVEGSCSVYPVRPLSCRGWNSVNVAKCETDYNHPERKGTTTIYGPQLATTRAIDGGINQGLARSGLDGHEVDLAPALAILFDVPDAAERWLAGEDVFKPAWVPTSDREYQKAVDEQTAINRRANLN